MALSSSSKSPRLAPGLSESDVPEDIDSKTPPSAAVPLPIGKREAKAGFDERPGSLRPSPLSYRSIASLALGLDVLFIAATGLLSSTLYHYVVFGDAGPVQRSAAVALFVVLVFVGFANHNKLYNPNQLLLWNLQVSNVVWIWCATFFLLSGWLFLWKAGDDISRGAVITFWAVGLLVLLLHRSFWRFYIERALKRGLLRGRKVVLITGEGAVLDADFTVKLVRYGYETAQKFALDTASLKNMDGVLGEAITFVRGSDIEEILLVVPGRDTRELGQIVERLSILPIPVTWIAHGATAALVRHPWYELGPVMAVEVQRPPRSGFELALKRAVDIAGAACGLVLLAPLLAVAAAAIKIDSPGPVFFWQTRRGFNGKPFRILKFRSMSVLEDGDHIRQATKGDARVTRVGAWLRKTSIDEIPQLFNVLRGDMSLVGPRPHAVAHDDAFIGAVEDYAYRHHVKPGITGWAQVHGHRGEIPTLKSIERRVELDRWYIANWSLWLDFKILLRTLTVIRGRNAY
jgi:Undecaprenyl-phosphate glucose phosphotransferase